MTNHFIDFKNTDCALIIGSNAAENHPMSFKWLTEAREKRGAKIIHVDPRYTRTSARSDIYAPLRSGTDIAFIGGLINYAIQNNRYHHDYVVNYTNASFLVNPKYGFSDGLFTGYDPKNRKYDQSSWAYQKDENGKFKRDMSLQDPNCVFQILKRHYSRYDVDTVCRITGTPKDVYLQVAEAYCATGAPEKTGTILYAMGTTQHTVGSQNVRIYAMIQLLLGNTGRPGGGVNALRGESNVQGSTDMGLLQHLLPGYLNSPVANAKYATLADYLRTETPATSFQANKPKWMVSMLKAFYGPNATKENDFGYDWLPKRDPNRKYEHIALFEAMYENVIKGLFLWGQNPVVGGPASLKEAKAMENLDWLVAVDLWETESSIFWKRPGVNPADIKTEVFFLPACSSYEKEGSIANSGRWTQWRWEALPPKGDSKSDLEIIHRLRNKIVEKYQGSTKPNDVPLLNMDWNYGSGDHPDIDLVAKEINGYDLTTGKQLPMFSALKDDGTTVCGVWIYSGQYTEEGNMLKRRKTTDPGGVGNYLEWSYAWPANRRIIYNRCSADPNGQPWAEDKADIWWDESQGKWAGYDVPDFGGTKPPYAPDGQDAYIMRPEGVGCIYSAVGDGPLPEHYEPWESPTKNPLSSVQLNPVTKIWDTPMNDKGDVSRFPYVGTTYRVSEHWQTGSMTRNLSWLSELMPYMYAEIGEDLAREKGIKNGDKVRVSSARGEIECYALVTKRMKAQDVNGQKVHHVGLPWHYGYSGIATGAIANHLTPHIGDANTMIPEYKAFLVDIRRVG